ncbi:class I SAM-dependent methyltransferase [Gammaproteobacteria bacterium]|nr:class I SAM-dependent methyltransferase [Gammaproteobacteria bacterium]
MTLAIGILILEVGVIVHLFVYTVITGISPVPTTPSVKAMMLEVAPGKEEGTILDLGSGWGTLTFAFARKYPRSQVIGYELSPIPLCFCQVRQWFKPQPNLIFQRRDYRKAPFDQAKLIVCYLFPRGMSELRPKFECELNAGCLVISNTFAVPGWGTDRVCTVKDQYATQIFVYEMPAKVDLYQVVEPAVMNDLKFVRKQQ